MKAARVLRFGPPAVITNDDVPQPKAGAGQLLVRVKAAGVGNWDALIREGKVELQSLPIILGSELSTADNWLRTSALCSRWRTRASPTRCLPAARIAAERSCSISIPDARNC
jgi:hypothetical protein